ncbi:MAG: hypothetical protein M3251_04390 [Thermoproteota archaeon]|nr:hypothetical protein [Thermoproteota archaeon]
MKVIKPARTTTLSILLTMIASSIAAFSSGAAISAFAQQSAIDVEQPDLPEIPEILQREDLIPCLPPPECLLPGAEVCIQVCWPFPEE